jgi:hypothetical protein
LFRINEGDATGTPWSGDDPEALMRWFHERGALELGRDVNKWLSVIYASSFMIWSDPDVIRRKAFRDAALAVTEAARSGRALPDSVITEKIIYIRMSYLANSDESPAWRHTEMAEIFDIFLDWLPVDIDSARTIASQAGSHGWRSQPIEVVKALRNIKAFLNLLQPGGDYLDNARRAMLDSWLSLLPKLP